MSREVPQCKQSGIALQLATSMMAQPKMARMQGSSLPGSEMTTSLLLPTSVGAKGFKPLLWCGRMPPGSAGVVSLSPSPSSSPIKEEGLLACHMSGRAEGQDSKVQIVRDEV
jgi:hypothetical protein